MIPTTEMVQYSTCDYANALPRAQCMDIGIRALWQPVQRTIGPAYTVRCEAGDNLMVHAAIYRAPKGSILVIDGGNSDFAMAGGNVCAVAARKGIRGFVVDGAVRDVEEIEQLRFPVFGRGLMPKPGRKEKLGDLDRPVTCGGVHVYPGDIVVADREGVVVIPSGSVEETFLKVRARTDREENQSIEEWEALHHVRIDRTLRELGYPD